MPTDSRKLADGLLTTVAICLLMVATGCQSYPPTANSELEYVVFPNGASTQTQIPNQMGQNRTSAANQSVTQPQISRPIPVAYPGRMATPVNTQSSLPAMNSAPRSAVQQASYQYPAFNPPANVPAPSTNPVIGFQPRPLAFQQTNPNNFPPPPNFNLPPDLPPIVDGPVIADVDVMVPSGPTGRLSLGATYGSNNGLVGQLILDERDFDILNWPRPATGGFQRNTFRGGGQTFRAEIVPGEDLERYLINWANPYFGGTQLSLSVSGYYFDRQYFDWDEQRAGGRVSLGRRLTEYLSVNTALRMESVTLDNPRVNTSPVLNADLGNSNLFVGSVGLEYDSRINPYNAQPDPFLTAQGSYLGLTFQQAFGDYSYSRGEIDFRRHRLIYARPDGSGRHTIGFRTQLGFSGSETPVFETYLAGGIASMRGFEFRGISPINGGVRVGGDFQWLNSLEYMFPLTGDDMIAGVMFIDFGTVEESVELQSENFRAAPGLGLRINLPYAGLGAPLAFDFAGPVATATGDLEQTFSFIVGVVR